MKDFIKACCDSEIDTLFCEERFHPLVRTLSLWSEVNGLVDTAARTRKLLRNWRTSDLFRACTLLTAFSKAFDGAQVEAMGRDIAEPFLHHERDHMRKAAVDALIRWGEDSYIFVEMLGDHYDREPEDWLQGHIGEALASFGYFDEEKGDCPECEKGMIESVEECWFCEECGSNWSIDPRGLFDDGEDMNKEENSPRSELLSWQAVSDAAQNHLHSAICTGQLPFVLQSLVGIHPHLTLDFIESYKIGHLSTRATNLNLYLGSYSEGSTRSQMYFWSETYAGVLHRLTTNDLDAPERWALEIQWE